MSMFEYTGNSIIYNPHFDFHYKYIPNSKRFFPVNVQNEKDLSEILSFSWRANRVNLRKSMKRTV